MKREMTSPSAYPAYLWLDLRPALGHRPVRFSPHTIEMAINCMPAADRARIIALARGFEGNPTGCPPPTPDLRTRVRPCRRPL